MGDRYSLVEKFIGVFVVSVILSGVFSGIIFILDTDICMFSTSIGTNVRLFIKIRFGLFVDGLTVMTSWFMHKIFCDVNDTMNVRWVKFKKTWDYWLIT